MNDRQSVSSPGREAADPQPITVRSPRLRDGAAIWRLVRRSEALDENSCYTYLLLSTHFERTCVVAECEGHVVGFVAAYVPPVKPEVIFVWQIGVDSAFRRSGLGKRLLVHLLSLRETRGARFLEATVTPSNRPSRRLFQSFAADLGVGCRETEGFCSEDFGGGPHEPEQLFRIGPLPERQ